MKTFSTGGGGKTAVYELVRALRGPAPSRVMVRFEGLPGELAQFDFGSVDVAYLSGQREKIRFAAYRLKYSRWVYVEIVPNEQVEALSGARIRRFEGSGGFPSRWSRNMFRGTYSRSAGRRRESRPY